MRLLRREFEPSLLDASAWPSVDPNMLRDEARRKALIRRVEAVKAWLSGTHGIVEIERNFKVGRAHLYQWVRNGLALHPDGRIYGFRALLPYSRPERESQCRSGNLTPKKRTLAKPHSYELLHLFGRYPELKQLVEDAFFSRATGDQVPLRIPIRDIHGIWLHRCRELGIGEHEWPFNTAYLGKVSLYRYLKRLKDRHPILTLVRREGTDVAKRFRLEAEQNPADPTMHRPFKRVLFDGHRIDAIFVLQLHDGTFVELPRAWLLVVQDVASLAILGYSICLRSEYSADDVLLCLKRAVMPWKRPELTVTGLRYPEKGGLPSEIIPSLAWACWDEVWLDRGLANMANVVRSELLECMGASINFGPPRMPTRRSPVEKCFDLLEQAGFSKLPNTTGRRVGDSRRARDPAAKAKQYRLTEQELAEIVAVVIADYNSRGHRPQSGVSPLQYLRQYADSEGKLIRKLDASRRNRLEIFVRRFTCTVRGNISKGVAPHINLKSARYSSTGLRAMTGLIGSQIRVHVDPMDLRSVKTFLPGGAELGILDVQGPWRSVPHTLRDRVDLMSRTQIRMAHNSARPHALDGLRRGRSLKRKAAMIAEARIRKSDSERETSQEPALVPEFIPVVLPSPDRVEPIEPLRRGLVDQLGQEAMDL
jgi:putative transposase